jgi:hypothetical protein
MRPIVTSKGTYNIDKLVEDSFDPLHSDLSHYASISGPIEGDIFVGRNQIGGIDIILMRGAEEVAKYFTFTDKKVRYSQINQFSSNQLPDTHKVWFCDLKVDAEVERNGVGQLMLKLLNNVMENSSIVHLLSSTINGNEALYRTFDDLGYIFINKLPFGDLQKKIGRQDALAIQLSSPDYNHRFLRYKRL